MPPSAIVIVRHGQSEHHVRGLTGGWTDTPLTDLGHQQARLVAGRLGQELAGAYVRVYSSDLLRASQTAAHIAAALSLPVLHDARLREHNNGESANMTVAEARARFPDGLDLRQFERVAPGAETGAEFYARARSFLGDLPGDAGLPVLVTHGGTARMLTAAWLRFTDDALDYAHFASHPTGITVLIAWREGGRERMVERANDIAHLHAAEGWMPLRDAVFR